MQIRQTHISPKATEFTRDLAWEHEPAFCYTVNYKTTDVLPAVHTGSKGNASSKPSSRMWCLDNCNFSFRL
jgi:hypothetical protein